MSANSKFFSKQREMGIPPSFFSGPGFALQNSETNKNCKKKTPDYGRISGVKIVIGNGANEMAKFSKSCGPRCCHRV